jgi:hypothetical protein
MDASDGPWPHGARNRRWDIGAVVVTAFAVRWLFAFGMGIDVRAQFLLDMSVYDMLARRLARARIPHHQPGVFFRYPAILAASPRLRRAWSSPDRQRRLAAHVPRVYAMAARLRPRRGSDGGCRRRSS